LISISLSEAKARLAKWAKERREELGLTQSEVGRRAGYQRAHINKVEKQGVGDPPLSLLVKLSNALEVPLSVPLTKMGYLKPASSRDQKPTPAPVYYPMLSEEDQQLAEEFVKTLWRKRNLKTDQTIKRRRRTA
jgi:transcriptional regulator with XRE-family HTH domain